MSWGKVIQSNILKVSRNYTYTPVFVPALPLAVALTSSLYLRTLLMFVLLTSVHDDV